MTWQHPNPNPNDGYRPYTALERKAYGKGCAKGRAELARAERATAAALDNMRNAWQALRLVRFALQEVAPAGCLESEEAVTKNIGPEAIHEGEALAKAIIEMSRKLTA